ncbi:hypothetical protein PIB30_079655 [Stylosanthes scabra]|uniref:Uncharacterized protein n=1 Tax=Stylosanthes scabra TaxID=79078 RepID=A0ABU6RR71_9FABA|nr:hypothetical protein [Stylosanthes scabra]
MVHNENNEEEEEEGEDDWLYELLAELADSDYLDDEEVEEAPEKEVDVEVVEEETKGETFFIATIFCGNKVAEPEIPIKCEDPSPCLVTCKIRGIDIPECLCDPGACAEIAENVLVKIKPDTPLKSARGKESEELKTSSFKEKGLRIAPPQLKNKKKKAPLNLERKKEKKKHEEGEPKKKVILKYSSFSKLLGKLKIFKEVLHHHKSMDAHLVRDNSKWK